MERMPQRRWGQLDDSARLMTWLLSDDGRWVVVVGDKRGGALGRTRTCDRQIRRLLLYPLSYEGVSPGYYADSARSAAEARCS